MENIKLIMNYAGRSVAVKVDDTDSSSLLDVIGDMLDESENHGMPLPKHPVLSYCYKMNSVKLLDDKGLMEMFSRFSDKTEIDIWIGCDETPCHVLTLARQLRANSKSGSVNVVKPTDVVEPVIVPNVVSGNREKLPYRKPNTTKPTSPVLSPRRSARFTEPTDDNVIVLSNASFTSPCRTVIDDGIGVITSETSPLVPRRSERLSQIPNTNSSQASHLVQVSDSQVKTQLFKMAITTARRRGLYDPKHYRTDTRGESSKRVRSKSVGREEGGDVDSDDSDGSYEPSDDDDIGNEDEGMSDLETEDGLILGNLEFIDDGYVPFEQTGWVYDEEEDLGRLYGNGELYEGKEFGTITLRSWMLFVDKDHFREVLRDYCIQEGFYIIVERADSRRYTAVCSTVNCEWRIHASVLVDGTTWAIKSIQNPEHGCKGVKNYNPMANAHWGASKLREDIRANPDIPASSLQKLLMDRFGVEMKRSTLYRMRAICKTEIDGSHDESFRHMPAYCELVKKTNPESVAHCAWVDRTLVFKSVFVSFAAQFKGLMAGCRSLIGVDGTHLKGEYDGVLLTAVALDGNNELFPIAVAVVGAESKETWSNFFWHLRDLLKDSERTDWTIISDRQKGVEPALDEVWPEAYRRYCARHLCKNFKSEYPGLLMNQLFWRVVNATSEFVFKKALETVVRVKGLGCARWFLDLGDKQLWTKHMFDPRIASDDNTSNFVESFNATLGVDRGLPILSLLEGIRRTTMVRHATRQHIAESWPDEGVCPKIVSKVTVLTKDSRHCRAYASAKGEFEVHEGKSSLAVSLNRRTCACGLWQISGIPCKHAIRAILEANKDPIDYVSEWFSMRRYKAAYSFTINPIPDLEQWPVFDVPELEPPKLKRAIGRPSKNRRREKGEPRKGKRSTTVKCTKCGCYGHNKKTCKGGYTAKQKSAIQGHLANSGSQLSRESYVRLFDSIDALETTVMEGSSTQTTVEAATSKKRAGKKKKTA